MTLRASVGALGIAAVVVAVLNDPTPLEACSVVCLNASTKQALRSADWVLVAQVSDIRWDVLNQLGTAILEPLALYTGKLSPRYEVETGRGGSCRFTMVKGERYLLFLQQEVPGAPLRVDGCAPNGVVAKSSDTLRQLRRHLRWSASERRGRHEECGQAP